MLLGIGIYVSLLIFYTFETLFFSGLTYIILIPISYFHYRNINKKRLITANAEEETQELQPMRRLCESPVQLQRGVLQQCGDWI